MFVHRIQSGWSRDIEYVATLADKPDQAGAYRHERRELSLALDFDCAYLIESKDRDEVARKRFDRFLQALDTLDERQRLALELSPDRMAALAMLDELRGLYATGELDGARRLGERCYLDLRNAFGVTPEGEAKILRPIVVEPRELAWLCERALAMFLNEPQKALGRVKQLLPLAADLGGGERAPHETRDERGRRTAFASPSTDGFTTIDLPFGVVHPSQWEAVAQRLGVTVDEARSRLIAIESDSYEDEDIESSPGPRTLADEIGADLLVRAIPVIPDDERPTLYFLPRDRYATSTEVRDPLTHLYGSLAARIHRFNELQRLGAADILLDHDAAITQRIVDEIAHAAANPPDPKALDGWGITSAPKPVPLWNPKHDEMWRTGDEDPAPSDTPPTAAWLSDDRVAIATEDVVRILSLRERRVLQSIPISGTRLQACDSSGRYLITTGNSLQFDRGVCSGFGCLDTETGAWLETLPDHIPAVSFGKDQPEDGVLFEHRRSGSFSAIDGDRPTAMCWSRGNHHVFVSGDYSGLYHGSIRTTAQCFEEVSGHVLEKRAESVAPTLLADGSLSDGEIHVEERELAMYEPAACAMTKTDRWWFLMPTRHLCTPERTYCQLGFPVDAASFSPDGRRLFVLSNELLILDVSIVAEIGADAIVWRAALDTLA